MLRSRPLLLSLCAGIAAACAPAPDASDDTRPDLTGVWTTYGVPDPTLSFDPPPTDVPLAPAAQARRDAYRAATDGTDETPGGYCVGTGMPELVMRSGVYPMEIIQRPEQITQIFEFHGEVRRLYLDARGADVESVFPERNGFSVGRWEGDVLVVETGHLVEQVDTHYPHSADAALREEYRLSMAGETRVLTLTMTLTDPAWLTRPYTAEKKWQAVPGGRLMSYECMEPVWLDKLGELLGEE